MDRYMQPFETIPVPKYSKELKTAVQDEARRQAIDAAKKRAAAQNVDYETFSALVSMAHIKPFERSRGRVNNIQRPPIAPAWSFDATGCVGTSMDFQETSIEVGDPSSRASGGAKQSLCLDRRSLTSEGSEVSCIENPLFELGKPSTGSIIDGAVHSQKITIMKSLGCSQKSTLHKRFELPATGFNDPSCRHPSFMTADAFKSEWKRAGSSLQNKLMFLLGIPPDELPSIFKVEVPPSILADLFDALSLWKQSSCQAGVGVSPPSSGRSMQVQITHKPRAQKSTGRDEVGRVDKTETECNVFHKKFDVVLVFSILEALSKCGRFSLSLKLVGENARSSAITLINYVMECMRKNAIDKEKPENLLPGALPSESCKLLKKDVDHGLLERSKRVGEWLSEVELIHDSEVQQLALIYSST